MRKDMITMGTKEMERLRIVHKLMEKGLTQVRAAELMGVTDRQVRRILGRVEERRDSGVIHGNRGRPSPRRIPKEEERIIGLVKKRYSDFGRTFASEKLQECEGLGLVGRSCGNGWRVHGLWEVRSSKRGKIYEWRERNHHVSEMVQMELSSSERKD